MAYSLASASLPPGDTGTNVDDDIERHLLRRRALELVDLPRQPDDLRRCGDPGLGSTTLYETPLDGGASTQLATASTILAVATDATSVYWTGGVLQTSGMVDIPMGAVMKVPLAGGTPVTLTTGSLPLWGGIAVDEANVYYAGSSCPNMMCSGTVMKVPIGGGAPVTMTVGIDLAPSGIAVDATSVYFVANKGVFKVTPK